MQGKPCNNWMQTGSCKYGDNCRFSHGGGQPASGGNGSNPRFNQNTNRSNGPSFIRRDNNPNGEVGFNNRSPNDRPFNRRPRGVNTETLCNFFLQGKCTRGDSCQFLLVEILNKLNLGVFINSHWIGI